MISKGAKKAKVDAISSPSDNFAFWTPVEIGKDCTEKPEGYGFWHDRSLGFTVVGIWFHDFDVFTRFSCVVLGFGDSKTDL